MQSLKPPAGAASVKKIQEKKKEAPKKVASTKFIKFKISLPMRSARLLMESALVAHEIVKGFMRSTVRIRFATASVAHEVVKGFMSSRARMRFATF